jgi:citrate/tricarballylate utilization protein
VSAGPEHVNSLMLEGERLMTICNACRYCEGYCAVFPAMERRQNFSRADLNYLANLCHNCAECYYACQYAPPHEFAVNVPLVLAQIRVESYRQYALPNWFGVAVLPIVAISLIVFLAAVWGHAASGANFYGVISHTAMVRVFGAASFFVVAALLAGIVRCFRELPLPNSRRSFVQPLWKALREALTLKYLDNDGVGCSYQVGRAYPGEQHSQARRWFHHLTFYGFLLCFASTSVAAFYHYMLGWTAPYGYFSLPVVLGTFGGAGLLIGPCGLYWLLCRRDPSIGDAKQDSATTALLALLFFVSLTGLLLLAFRNTRAMSLILGIHLGTVAALFLAMPYGKFVHGVYRLGALIRYALEGTGPTKDHL